MIDYVSQNWPIFLGIAAGIIAVAEGMARLTKTPKDDRIVAKVKALFKRIKEAVR